MKHAMIDIETLGTKPTSAVISLGVAIFDDKEVIETYGEAIDPAKFRGDIDPKTIAWWMQQGDEARAFSFGGKADPFNVAFNLKTLLAKHEVFEVWANDPDFDIVILRNWWEEISAAGKFPIGYKQPRAFRTIVGECRALDYDPWKESGMFVAHNPIDDAGAQARVVIAARRFLRNGR